MDFGVTPKFGPLAPPQIGAGVGVVLNGRAGQERPWKYSRKLHFTVPRCWSSNFSQPVLNYVAQKEEERTRYDLFDEVLDIRTYVAELAAVAGLTDTRERLAHGIVNARGVMKTTVSRTLQ